MEVAKATLKRITLWKHTRTFTHFLLLLFAMACAGEAEINCPQKCRCFHVLPDDLKNPPTYNRVIGGESTNDTLIAVSCQRQQLTSVPHGIPLDTAVLFLSYNSLTHLNRSMFAELRMLQTLELSHNSLTSIDNDTFDDMLRLEHLELSYNNLREFPDGFLCPWNTMENDCDGSKAQTRLRLSTGQNPWHCNCRLQHIIEHYSCTYGQSPCIDFSQAPLDAVGKCNSPERTKGFSILSLTSQTGKDDYNACSSRDSHVDYPLLVTMFTWMGAVLGYVVYFILWNQREIINHQSYLSTLNFQAEQQKEDETKTTGQSRPLTVGSDSVFIRQTRPPSKTVKEQLEMQPIQQQTPSVRVQKPSNSDVWVARSNSDLSLDRGKYGIQMRQRIVQMRPFSGRVRPCNSVPSNLQTYCDEDVYRLSSL